MLRPMYKNIPMMCANFSCLAAKSHAADAQKNRLNERIPMISQNTSLNQCTRKRPSSVLTPKIAYWYSKEPSQRDHSDELPNKPHVKTNALKASVIFANFSYLVTKITCTFAGTQRNRLDETTIMSSQNTCLNQCTREPPLPVLTFHIWWQKSYVVGTHRSHLHETTLMSSRYLQSK